MRYYDRITLDTLATTFPPQLFLPNLIEFGDISLNTNPSAGGCNVLKEKRLKNVYLFMGLPILVIIYKYIAHLKKLKDK